MADEKDQPKEKAVYTKSTAQLDAERRVALAEEAKDDAPVVEYRMSVNPSYGLEEDGGYVGVNPEYRNAADVRQEPLTSDEDWQKALLVEPAEDAGKPSKPFAEYVEATPAGPVTDPSPTSTATTPSPTPARQAAVPGSK